MKRGPHMLMAAALAMGALFLQSLSAPLPALACSCIDPLPSLARVAAEPNVAIIAGTVGAQQPERTPITVDTWFHGPGVTDVVWLNFGSQMMTSCDPVMTAGERRLMVISANGDGTFSYSPCAPAGVIGTDSGDKALAEAVALFAAEPTPPPTQPPELPRPNEPEASPAGMAWLLVAATLAAGAVVLGGVALYAVRRRRPG
jgi:hypothetical protein